MNKSLYTHLECVECEETYDKNELHTFCKTENCNQPLVARYDLSSKPGKEILVEEQSMWRYKYLLPVEKEENRIKNLFSYGWCKEILFPRKMCCGSLVTSAAA